MTTLAELVDLDPATSDGVPIQAEYGAGSWRLVVQLADPAQGASVDWYDITDFVAEMRWKRGADAPWGQYRATRPTLALWADGDALAPWNEDTSATFGTHVRLRAGLLVRAVVFRVADDSVDLSIPLFTSRVKRWGDGSVAMGRGRYHVVECLDLMSMLAYAPIGAQLQEGWRSRLDDILTASGWEFGADIYGAETVNGTPTITVPDRDATASTLAEIDAVLAPVGLAWRTTARGPLVVHPAPWTEFHDDIFDGAGTIVGTPWSNPLLGYYPNGVTFAFDPVAENGEVGFWPIAEGVSFGIASDLENVVNEWEVTYPSSSHDYDDAVSAGKYGRRPLPAASWIAENDDLVEEIVDARAESDLTASQLHTGLDVDGAFPAIAVLDHLDPVTVRHATRPDRDFVTAEGMLRSIGHTIRQRRTGRVSWKTVCEFDLETASTSAQLLPVVGLAVTAKDDTQATLGWTNPSQTLTPTGTQVRLLEESSEWIDTVYPITAFAWPWLTPEATYRFQVRLVRRVDGIITATSPVREVSFTMDPAEIPVPDPDGDGTTIVIPVDDPDCDIDWKLERSSDGTTWTTVDSGDQDDFTTNPSTGNLELDTSGYSYTDEYLYRLCTRQVCDEVAESWVCSTPFQPSCATPDVLGDEPYDTAVLFVPKVCGTSVFEAISGVEAGKGPAYDGIYPDGDNIALASDTSAGGVVAYGAAPVLEHYGNATISCRVSVQTKEDSTLFSIAGMRISAVAGATGWYPKASVTTLLGEDVTVTDSTERALITALDLMATYDASTGELELFVAGTSVGTDTADDPASRAHQGTGWRISAPTASWITNCAVWASVVSAGVDPPAAISGLVAWYDAFDESTITDTAGTVATWADKSDNGYDLTASGDPQTGTRTINGKNVIDLDGSDYFSADIMGSELYTSQALTLFVVFVVDSVASSSQGLVTLANRRGTNDYDLGAWISEVRTSRIGYARGNGESSPGPGDYDAEQSTTSVIGTSPHLLAVSADDSSGIAASRVDGADVSVSNYSGSMPVANFLSQDPGTLGLLVGSRRHNNNIISYLNGAVAEVILYDSVLSSGDRADIETYLSDKWGI